MKRLFPRIVLFILWSLLLAVGGLAYETHRFLISPGSETPEELVISIAPGATFDRVAWDLKKAGVITDVFRFRLLARFQGALGKIQAGEFQVNKAWNPVQVLKQLTEGRALLHRLSVREGLTWWETARVVAEQGFARYEDFKAVVHDPEFLRDHGIPFANAEGFLFPETYLMKKPRQPLDREQARIVASTMVRMFWQRTESLWAPPPAPSLLPDGSASASSSVDGAGETGTGGRTSMSESLAGSSENGKLSSGMQAANDSRGTSSPVGEAAATAQSAPGSSRPVDPAALRRLIILASLVEKETGLPSERGLVAGVYANRLRLGMLLQCDPTIIYGIGEGFTGAIRRSQLDDPGNPYNTYQHPGLPPGPICSPGFSSLRAAFAPDEHGYLYFVATGLDGGHVFSKTLQEHNKAVQTYRARIRGR